MSLSPGHYICCAVYGCDAAEEKLIHVCILTDARCVGEPGSSWVSPDWFKEWPEIKNIVELLEYETIEGRDIVNGNVVKHVFTRPSVAHRACDPDLLTALKLVMQERTEPTCLNEVNDRLL